MPETLITFGIAFFFSFVGTIPPGTLSLTIIQLGLGNKINIAWSTFVFEDNSYGHVLPVKGTASLEKDLWAELKSKIGQEAFDKLVSGLEASMESKKEGIIVAMPEHSYLDPAPDEKFRLSLFIFPLEGKESDTENLFLEWKKSYEEIKSPMAYHVYKMQYGNDKGYVINFPAKNAAEMEQKASESNQLLGETSSRLWKKQMSLTKRYYWRRGYFAPELGYKYTAAN